MIRRVATLAVAGALSLASPAAPADAPPHLGLYAARATAIWDEIANSPGARTTIVSPDGRSRATATFIDTGDGLVRITTSGRIGRGHVDVGPGVGSELLWAPDSLAFFVTTSDQGAIGHFRTVVVAAGRRGPIARDLSELIERAFGHPVACGSREHANVGGIRWVSASRELLVAAEIAPHTNCDSFGTFRAYPVDWRRQRIIRSFDQLKAKHRFRNALGKELRAAPDECVRTPKACWVNSNHLRR